MNQPSHINKDEFDDRNLISGTSVINHRIRINLKLSLEEYVLMDFIHSWNQKNTAPITFGDYFKATGFLSLEGIEEKFSRMKTMELLWWDDKKKRVDVCQEWKNAFKTDALVKELWSIHPKGNLQTAKERLPKVLLKIQIEMLIPKLKAYIASEPDEQYRKGLDVWLNPKKEHWNDPLVNKIQKGAVKTPTVSIKFKK